MPGEHLTIQQPDKVSESPAQHDALLGGGVDLNGRQIEFWGHVWTVVGKNYLWWWDAVRHEHLADGTVKVTTQIAPDVLPETHSKYARLLPAQ